MYLPPTEQRCVRFLNTSRDQPFRHASICHSVILSLTLNQKVSNRSSTTLNVLKTLNIQFSRKYSQNY